MPPSNEKLQNQIAIVRHQAMTLLSAVNDLLEIIQAKPRMGRPPKSEASAVAPTVAPLPAARKRRARRKRATNAGE